MAHQEQDREDLLRDATAFVERIEFLLRTDSTVFVGFRRDGCASVYVDQDPVYHFNTSNRLRRAYVNGWLYKAERRRLVAMERERRPGEVNLVRRELADDDVRRFLGEMHTCLQKIASGLNESEFTLVGQVPEDADVAGRVRRWLAELPARIAIADSARAV